MTSREKILRKFWNLLNLCEDHFTTGCEQKHEPPPSFPKPKLVSPREKQLLDLYQELEDCQKCLFRYTQGRVIMAEGPLSPELCVVSMAPELKDEQEYIVFSSSSGEYLKKWLEAINIKIVNTYRTTILKCCPPENNENISLESQICFNFFKKQIELVKPKIILVLGESPSLLLTGEKNKKLKELQGGIYSFGGIPVFCSYHPQNVLMYPELRSAVWKDLQHLRQFMDQNQE